MAWPSGRAIAMFAEALLLVQHYAPVISFTALDYQQSTRLPLVRMAFF
jgi:hypothetical protein